jgi:hypothetical protein
MRERDWAVEIERLESREATKALVLAVAGLVLSLMSNLVLLITISR